jgi:hypothetical protein
MGCIIIVTSFLILLAMGAWWLLFTTEAHFLFLNRDSAFEVAEVFTLALMENRIDVLKSLVVRDRWSQIEIWAGKHEAVRCPAPPWDLEDPPWIGIGAFSNNRNERSETLRLSLPCPDDTHLYCLTVKDLRLERKEEGWQIVDWDEIIEYQSEFSCSQ